MPERDLVFFSYRHDGEGERWLAALEGMLEPYLLAQQLIAWSDKDIRTGEKWHTQIQGAIDRTRVAVLLISQRFFGSEYIRRHELPRLLADASEGKLTVVCVLVAPTDERLIAEYGLGAFEFGHDRKKPLSMLVKRQREETLLKLAIKVSEAYGNSQTAVPEPVRVSIRQGKAVQPLQSAKMGELFDVPPLGRHLIPRPAELEAIRERLLQNTDLAHGLTASISGLGLHGMGGMGKSVMAQALCHDAIVRRAFPDGIAWIALGQDPDLSRLQNRLIRLLASEAPPADSPVDARKRLQQVLEGRRVLIVLDDVWDDRHAAAFDVIEGQSRLLVTTRDASVLSRIGALAHRLERLPDPPARELLARRSGCPVSTMPREADEVLEHTGGLPLALALAGAQVADGVSWTTVAQQLRHGRIDFLDHPYGSIYNSLGHSVDRLPPDEQERYLELAVFPEDAVIPMQVVARLWWHSGDLDAAWTEKLLARLDCQDLLTLSGEGAQRTVALHDLLHDFVRLRAESVTALHGRLLDAYRSTLSLPPGGPGWAKLPIDEPYLWQYLPMHLAAAGRMEELEAALLDRDWIEARLAAETRSAGDRVVADVSAVISDYDTMPSDSPCQLLGRALRASAHVLGVRPEVLDQQLFGRLGTSRTDSLRALSKQALSAIDRSEVWCPCLPALTPPGSLIAVLPRHEGWVTGALMLPDGHRVLSWSDDRTLRLWNLERGGEPLRVLSGHERPVTGALMLPDGRRVLSWSVDGTLRLWDLERGGEPLQVLSGHKRPVTGALMLPDGRGVLSWSYGRRLRLWDLEQAHEPRVLRGPKRPVRGALMLPNSRGVLSWSDDGTLRLWDLGRGGEPPQVLSGHKSPVTGALMLPDGPRVLSWSDDCTLRLWNLQQGGEPRVLSGHEAGVIGALMLPDGRRVLSWSYDRTLRLWDLEQGGAPLEVLSGHEGWVMGALMLPDAHRVLSWSDDRTLRLWDLKQGCEPRVLSGHEAGVMGALMLPDNRRVLSWSYDRTLRLWDLEQGSELRVLPGHEDKVMGALMLPDGRRVLSWSRDGTLRLWDPQQGGEPRVSCHGHPVTGALMLPNDSRVLSWSYDRTLRLWDLERGGAPLQVLTGHEGWVMGALMLPDAHRVLSWSDDRTLRLWDLKQAGEPWVLRGHEAGVIGALMLPDGGVLSWSLDRTLRLWDLEQDGESRVLLGHEAGVMGALMLPDNRRVLSWSGDCTLRLWDLKRNGKSRMLSGHKGLVRGALVLPDGRRMLSWSGDGTLRLWDLEQDGESRLLSWHEAGFMGTLMLPDGRRVLSWSDDGMLRLWDLEQDGEPRLLSWREAGVIGTLMLPDGRRVLSWSDDGTLRLWDLGQGSESRVLAGHEREVAGVLLLPDGRRALSWSADRTVRLFDLSSGMQLGCYVADAAITTVVLSSDGHLAFVGDAVGFVQILRIKDQQGAS